MLQTLKYFYKGFFLTNKKTLTNATPSFKCANLVFLISVIFLIDLKSLQISLITFTLFFLLRVLKNNKTHFFQPKFHRLNILQCLHQKFDVFY